ncbi:MAG TPA: hypothetical protein VEK08_23115 [Planctomycetota bacterium]|nr:hypothetical protein [Planctomycetota bacterium]
MKSTFCLLTLFCAAVLLQMAVFPAFLPGLLRPDVGILFGIAAIAYAPREFGLITLFVMGLQADIFGSERFGLLTLSYLLAAGMILWVAWRELTRGDLLAAWIGGIAGTALAHAFYVLIGKFSGHDILWGQAVATWFSLVLSACVWGLPCAWLCGQFTFRLGVMDLAVHERWATEARLAAARRGKLVRG